MTGATPLPGLSFGTPILRRKVGFEFELGDVHTYAKSWSPLNWNAPYPMAKKDKLLWGTGYTLEADEMPNYSDAEIVTDAFDETPEGGKKLVAALNEIEQLLRFLQKPTNTNREISASELPVGKANWNSFLEVKQALLTAKPQATAGVRLDAMDRFFEEIGYQEGKGRTGAMMFGGQMGAKAGMRDENARGEGMMDVQHARAAAVEIIRARAGDSDDSAVLKGPELTALVTQLTMYLVVGANGTPGYAKTIAGGIMNRTDFAATYQQLPREIQDYFNADKERFVGLVIASAKVAAAEQDYKGEMKPDDSIFEGGIYNDYAMYNTSPEYKSQMPKLARRAWLEGIVDGKDLLTMAHFPTTDKKARNEIESLGSYGKNMDPVGNVGDKAPIIEFRGLKPLYAGLLTPMALDLYRYVHILNTGAREDYPGTLNTLSGDESFDLIQGTGEEKRKALIAEALQKIGNW